MPFFLVFRNDKYIYLAGVAFRMAQINLREKLLEDVQNFIVDKAIFDFVQSYHNDKKKMDQINMKTKLDDYAQQQEIREDKHNQALNAERERLMQEEQKAERERAEKMEREAKAKKNKAESKEISESSDEYEDVTEESRYHEPMMKKPRIDLTPSPESENDNFNSSEDEEEEEEENEESEEEEEEEEESDYDDNDDDDDEYEDEYDGTSEDEEWNQNKVTEEDEEEITATKRRTKSKEYQRKRAALKTEKGSRKRGRNYEDEEGEETGSQREESTEEEKEKKEEEEEADDDEPIGEYYEEEGTDDDDDGGAEYDGETQELTSATTPEPEKLAYFDEEDNAMLRKAWGEVAKEPENEGLTLPMIYKVLPPMTLMTGNDAPSGCSRSEVYSGRNKKKITMKPEHREETVENTAGRGANRLNEKKKLEFAKSGIHGYGLFTRGPIAQGDTVIEYVGELIRSSVADIREEIYQSSNNNDDKMSGSSYMFSLGNTTVIDATEKGSISRFINHCCDVKHITHTYIHTYVQHNNHIFFYIPLPPFLPFFPPLFFSSLFIL